MNKAEGEARLRVGRRVSVRPDADVWDGEVTGTVIVKSESPSTWWVLVDEGAYRDKFGSWVMVRMDDLGNLSVYETKDAKGK